MTLDETRPPTLPLTEATARRCVRDAEISWNSCDPDRVLVAYAADAIWRDRDTFVGGHDEIRKFLTTKWSREGEYSLYSDLWTFGDRRLSVRFQSEWCDADHRWWRSYGLEHWDFDDHGLIRSREASGDDVAIKMTDRRIFGPRQPGDPAGIPLR